MIEIKADAYPWKKGWELWLNGEAVTQVASLERAEQQILDYMNTVDPLLDTRNLNVVVKPHIGAMSDAVAKSRAATALAAKAQEEAAARARRLVQDLRKEGFSVADVASILGVSKGRVSQLSKRTL